MRRFHGTFSAHKVVSRNEMDLDPDEYSRMKYGSKTVARKYGYDLATVFLNHVLDINNKTIPIDKKNYGDLFFLRFFKEKQVVVIPSPYDFVPTATFAIKDYFMTGLNDLLIDLGSKPAQETKVHRTRSYNEDYGNMSAEDREKAISADGFHIDKEFVKGKFVIFLDDIKITGGHEKRMEQMIECFDLDCDYMYMYYACLTDPTTDPAIENYLNHYSINDLWDIDRIVKNEEFLFNTRVVKYILAASEVEFCVFIAHQSETFRRSLHFYLIGNKYHELPEFAKNVEHLRSGSYLSFVKSLSK